MSSEVPQEVKMANPLNNRGLNPLSGSGYDPVELSRWERFSNKLPLLLLIGSLAALAASPFGGIGEVFDDAKDLVIGGGQGENNIDTSFTTGGLPIPGEAVVTFSSNGQVVIGEN